jgi:GMP synthase-like glutamine amidotransferase
MAKSSFGKIRAAILNLYNGEENEGMRGIRDILQQFCREHSLELTLAEFDVRQQGLLPDMDHDIYISSGGPGSPVDSQGTDWDNAYFDWLNAISRFNEDPSNKVKKQVFLICHSLQMVCRHYELASVIKRKSPAFGIFPVHPLPNVKNEPIFRGLPDPFYAVDNREFQIVQPNLEKLAAMGARILAIEKERPHVPLERAIMAIRFNDFMTGTQFHPEADVEGMNRYLNRPDKKQAIIETHGEEKWRSMVDQLGDADKLAFTHGHILPNFLKQAISRMGIETKAAS